MKIIRRDPFIRSFLSPVMWSDDDFVTDFPTSTGIDVLEKDGTIVVKAPVPGLKPEDVDVTYEDGVLNIKAHSEEKNEEKKGDSIVHRKEMVTSFSYTTTLPRPVDVESMEARVTNGVVTVTAPISQAAKQRKITVKEK